ncbi:MAG: cache domain-containing protein [Methanoregulaceae archaeon]|nr:cache domain-containing protein [Methanoregulaceae archaeon]
MIALGAIAIVSFFGLIALAAMAPGEQVPATVNGQYEMQRALLEAEGSVGHDLAAMDTAVTAGAVRIGTTGFNGTETKTELVKMGDFPWAIDTITIDEHGIINNVEPESFRSVIGENLSDQEHLQRLYREKVPVMSDVFLSVEGVPAVDVASPVFSSDGRFIGATTLLFKPGPFFVKNTPNKPDGTPWHLMVMQKDGLVVYDPDTVQIGKNAFTDPLFKPFPDLIALAGEMSRERVGSGTYTFTDAKGMNVTKEAVWTTVGIRGAEWRLVIIRIVGPANS